MAAMEPARSLLALLLLGCLANAQIVQVANRSAVAFEGWKRTVVDVRPPAAAGARGDLRYVLGRRTGLDTWAVDLHLKLAAGEQQTLDLSTFPATPVAPVLAPADPAHYFGGACRVGGVALAIAAVAIDGAAVSGHLQGRIAPMLHVDVWTMWYPDQPGMMTGEAVVTCSNGSIPDLGATIDKPLHLAFGDAVVDVAGAGRGAPLVPAGTAFSDGQARAVPFVLGWPRHLADPRAQVQHAAAAGRTTCAVGITQLWPDGNPLYPPRFSPMAWNRELFAESLRRLHTWQPALIGPASQSGVSGSQEDQVFVRGEALLPNGTGAEQTAYLAALKLAARPCHHLEADGRQADPNDHPKCVFWAGRPHYHTGVSPDQLGKRGALPDTHGWSGPDREHWLYNTVAAASRLVDSPALQWELSQQARLFLFGETVAPGLSTSSPDASRSVGWASILAVHLWRGLEDRELADRVAARYRERCRLLYLPAFGAAPGDIWDVRVDDARLGPGAWWMPWQQAVGAYGLDLAGQVFQMPAVRDLGLRAATVLLREAWVQVGNRWQSRAQMAVAGGGPSNESFNLYGMPMAIATVLRHDPTNERASAIWRQLLADAAANKTTSWLAPGIVVRAAPPAVSPPDEAPSPRR